MGLRDFFRQLKTRRRERSEARSEVGPIGESSEVGLVTPRSTGSAPNLCVGVPTLPASGPPASRGQYSNGLQTCSSWSTRLTALYRTAQMALLLFLDFGLLRAKNEPHTRNLQISQSNRVC